MGRKIDSPEFFRNGTGFYCLFCAHIDVNDNKQLFWFSHKKYISKISLYRFLC
jgi:hypothetical protein